MVNRKMDTSQCGYFDFIIYLLVRGKGEGGEILRMVGMQKRIVSAYQYKYYKCDLDFRRLRCYCRFPPYSRGQNMRLSSSPRYHISAQYKPSSMSRLSFSINTGSARPIFSSTPGFSISFPLPVPSPPLPSQHPSSLPQSSFVPHSPQHCDFSALIRNLIRGGTTPLPSIARLGNINFASFPEPIVTLLLAKKLDSSLRNGGLLGVGVVGRDIARMDGLPLSSTFEFLRGRFRGAVEP